MIRNFKFGTKTPRKLCDSVQGSLSLKIKYNRRKKEKEKITAARNYTSYATAIIHGYKDGWVVEVVFRITNI
jgi:hypothetical protein